MKNFNFPYLAQDLSDFWRRWHISLSTWFRDYVYIPLGGSRVSKARLCINILIVFLVSGLWHGANLTFVFWGLVHALCVLPILLFVKINRTYNKKRMLPTLSELLRIGCTFLIVVLAWVFFRAETITDAFQYLSIIFSESLFSKPYLPLSGIALLFGYMVWEWIQRHRNHILDVDFITLKPLRYGFYYVIVFCVFYFAGDLQPFIYFQF